MEESAQRKERLKAMRMEASSQEGPTYNEGGEPSAVSLSNPLLEPMANPNSQVHPSGQTFNYYTNPMAAYSGNKQKTNVNPQMSNEYSSILPRPQTNDMFPSPSFRPHLNHSSIPRMQPPPHGQYQNPNFSYTPNTPQPQGGYPGPGPYRGPHFTSGPGRGNYPSPGPRYPFPGPSPGRGYRYPSPGPHLNHGSGPGYPTSTSGPNQGRGQWFGNNMSSGRGMGRGRWSGQGQGQGQGQGGGRGAHYDVTAEDRPDLFYNKSMVEDPWKFLEPVIWKSLKKPKPWLLYSSNTKKQRVSPSRHQQQQSSSQPSLAEILAASFNEAATGEQDAAQ
ncbi:protein SICKLE [Lactuca sativa]|uniref:Uncharacterized protein n=1 Tax=Lactuca sativa TaxID=4236 RepID=A0A9R1W3H8_LACSA|nr:protein SICKLE [Lactuca sativa]XP_023770400.1 protein SICKLE [Lactuca sativa]KAJ0219142.1 hypothetical protein LSAT_V11C300154230 [Lactuca sativa]